ncbi:hypothetical protein JCM11491_004523 [Sporobolomyces phaffii]
MPALASNGGSSLHFLSQHDSFTQLPRHSRPTSSSGAYESDRRPSRYSSSDDESSTSPSSSPERVPTLAPPIPSISSLPTRVSSPKPSPSGMAVPASREERSAVEEEDEDERDEIRESAFTPLPSSLPRPKTKADREREKSLGLNSGPGKKDSMAKKMMRKRADSLKWAKYATAGSFEIELDLSNDDLRRN